MPNKLTDAEIKKALECCNQNDCRTCPYGKYNISGWCCMPKMRKDALDLINRQDLKIHQLEKQVSEIQNANLIDFKATIGNYIAENESLKAENEKLNNNISAMATTLSTSARATRHEAYKECLDELARRLGYAFLRKHNCVLDIMENLLNELVGDGD